MMQQELIRQIPSIRRARGYRLYTAAGTRLVDFYQNAGRAILGYRPPGLSTAVENVLSRGLWAELPSVEERHLAKALADLFPGYREIRVYLGPERALAAAGAHLGRPVAAAADPAMTDPDALQDEDLQLWRPFLPPTERAPAAILPVLPFPGAFGPQPVCFREQPGPDVPPGDLISPILLEGVQRTVHRLRLLLDRPPEVMWEPFESTLWTRRGPYLAFVCGAERYRELFRLLLERGILIAPDPALPAVVPMEYTPGEVKPLLRLIEQAEGDGWDPKR